jgi:aryl-alcohol dehydrogenase-like predicted oxidoreductase
MRLSASPSGPQRGADLDEAAALAVLDVALARGVRSFDTARAYGDNERLLRRSIEARGVERSSVRIITKCGMTRPDGAWVPDGRRARLIEDAEASADALGGPPDLLLLHAPDPSVPLATSARALAEIVDRGLARAVGVSNVRRGELDEARAHAPITAVEIALGAYDDAAARSGLVRYALSLGLEVLCYAPFGGPTKSARIARDAALSGVGRAIGASPHRTLLAYLEGLDPTLSFVVGPRTVATLADCLSPAGPLSEALVERLDQRFEGLASLRPRKAPSPSRAENAPEIAITVGIAGSGKSSFASAWIRAREERGISATRLNRDTLGGTIKGIARRLDEALAAGARAVMLDNTYLGRAERADVLRVAERRGARTTCVFVDTPIEDALHNVALRMIERHGRLIEPAEWPALAKSDPGLVRPTALYRMAREIEPPTADEGFDAIDRVSFARRSGEGGPALAISIEAATDAAAAAIAASSPDVPILFFGFRPDGAPSAWSERVEARVRAFATGDRAVELAICAHGGGPPTCFCRPPLPGLVLAFAAKHRVDPMKLAFVAGATSERTMAKRLGAQLRG